ncbi:lytic transglycosylase domain-containing protein [Jannaschia seohaensis]|uniref:Transglycosylase SLT domain-containing protein n=1 Tax=Jannaschia seohaensis TaxID=475081 RepID=A0A2Y9B253_9RHOB|nr:transglycosylase-like protein with SLT domain [Jannaschia seohaensis]SSA49037.1 Transglycosylase SLT domain-containing protein [Jannaschia seohaensis]
MIRALIPLVFALAACAQAPAPDVTREAPAAVPLFPGETPEVRRLVNKWADYYDLPRSLVHRVIQRESDYRPGARNGPYWGMMQILPATARNMGFSGEPTRLLDADTALKYSIRYLRGAWMVADGSEQEAMMWYAKGYYYEAKRQGLLQETGLRGDLWQRYDRGEAQMPALDAAGNVLPAAASEPSCTPATGFQRLIRAETCTDPA